jgi:hypothetical protein
MCSSIRGSFCSVRDDGEWEMGYFMWSEWDVPRQMEAKLATESLYISSIVLLPSPSPSSITVSVFFV